MSVRFVSAQHGRWFLAGTVMLLCAACAAPLKTRPTPFADPGTLPHVEINGLVVGIEVLDTPERSNQAFGTDLGVAGVLPVRLIAKNAGSHEFEVDSRQVFGVVTDGQFLQAYDLDQATGEIRGSSIGTTVATGAAVGALAGAAVGAGVGAGIGSAAGDTGTGAASGAAIGGTLGAAHGAGAGASDWITVDFRRQLAAAQFGDKVLFPGNLHQGYVFLPRSDFARIRLLVLDITDGRSREVSVPLK